MPLAPSSIPPASLTADLRSLSSPPSRATGPNPPKIDEFSAKLAQRPAQNTLIFLGLVPSSSTTPNTSRTPR